MTRLVIVTATVALVVMPAAAWAEADVEVETTETVPVGKPRARVTLPGGKLLVSAILEANLAEGVVGEPLSIAPDLWVGVTDRLTLGLIHSGRAATGFLTGFGTGLCFGGGGEMGPCTYGLGDLYTFVGGEARIGLRDGGFAVAFVGGLHVRAFDPAPVVSGKAGFLARLHTDRLAVELAPSLYIGITARTITVFGVEYPLNVDELRAPVTVYLRLVGSLALAVQSGVTFVLDDAGNTWQIPGAVGLSWWVTPHFSFDAAFGLAAVADSNDMTEAFDRRSVTVGLGYAL